MKKYISALLCLLFLSGCTAGMKDSTEQSTVSQQSNTSSTNVAETTVRIDNVLAQNYDTQKVVWGPGRGENHERPSEPFHFRKSTESSALSLL